MTLIIEDGKVVNRTNKTIDTLKREPYGHPGLREEVEEIESFVDSLEELEDGEDSIPGEGLDTNAVEIAMQYVEFKSVFCKAFGPDELYGAFTQFEEFFLQKGVDTSLDMMGYDEGIPGMESSEQSIMTSGFEGQ